MTNKITNDIKREVAEKKRFLDRLKKAQLKNDDIRCDLLYQQIAAQNEKIENLKQLKYFFDSA